MNQLSSVLLDYKFLAIEKLFLIFIKHIEQREVELVFS